MQGFAVFKVGAMDLKAIDLEWGPSGLVFGASVETPAEGAESQEPTEWEAAVRQIRAEREAFERNKEQILREHEGQYVAILNGRVIDDDADHGILAQRVYGRVGRRPVLFTRATREPEVAVVRRGHFRSAAR